MVTPISCRSAFVVSTVLLLLLATADTVNASRTPPKSLQRASDPRQQQTAYNVREAKHDVIRAFDPINYASELSDEMKRQPFDSIEHASDFGEFKRKFDSIEHSSDLTDFSKRDLFDSISHSSDFDELTKRPSLDVKLHPALNKQHLTAAGLLHQRHRTQKQLQDTKRRFDSISHASDLDDFKRSTGVDLTVDDAQEGSDDLYKLVAEDKRKFDSIDHVSDLESFKRSL